MTNTKTTPKIAAAALSRTNLCKAMAAALRERSGKTWSVTGGRGTAYGWIRISAPPKRLDAGRLTNEDAAELAALLGKSEPIYYAELVPANNDYRQEYADRCCGLPPSVIGTPYLD